MMNKDKSMMGACLSKEAITLFDDFRCEHPLDLEAVTSIRELYTSIRDEDDDYEIFRHPNITDGLWNLLLSKAVKCLRYYDEREPFMSNNEKKPKAYGLDELNEYYQKYRKFESMLYGSIQYYRYHVVHVFRAWLSGVECMVKNGGAYLKCISIREAEYIELNCAEKLSIWTIIALTHDLGYPLEKAKDIIDATRSMISTFVTNPDISMDLSFHGVQNYMNDFIVRLMSSKMLFAGTEKNSAGEEIKKYVARLQPKYYFKFQKSLERTKHGIISTLIIYKLLTYFLESDYNINEDYKFDTEDRRQFYIRREILRAIASHTCTDVYHLYMGSFAFLLIVADDTQEWGRKYISELYLPSESQYELDEILLTISEDSDKKPHVCQLGEKLTIPEKKGMRSVVALIKRLRDQALNYVTIFRDGQDTIKRDFSFVRKFSIIYESRPNINFNMKLTISNDEASCLIGDIEYSGNQIKNKVFSMEFCAMLGADLGANVKLDIFDNAGALADLAKPVTWKTGKFSICLAN